MASQGLRAAVELLCLQEPMRQPASSKPCACPDIIAHAAQNPPTAGKLHTSPCWDTAEAPPHAARCTTSSSACSHPREAGSTLSLFHQWHPCMCSARERALRACRSPGSLPRWPQCAHSACERVLHTRRSPASSPRWPRCWCPLCAPARRAARCARAPPRRTTRPRCPTAPTSSTACSRWRPHTWCAPPRALTSRAGFFHCVFIAGVRIPGARHPRARRQAVLALASAGRPGSSPCLLASDHAWHPCA